MQKYRIPLNWTLMIAAALLLSGALFSLAAWPALAQDPRPTLTLTPVPTATRTPTPNPTATAAAAFFTIEQAEMTSRYPAGVEYVLRASSSAGTIARVQVSSWTKESTPSSHPLEWDAARGAFVYYDRFYLPPWFEIHYHFRITDSAGNVYQTEEQIREYEDPTRKWTRLEDDNVILLYFGLRDTLAEDLFRSSSGATDRLEDAFGFSLDYRPYVVVMPDATSFDEWQEYPEPFLAGQTYSGLGYTIQTLQWGEDDLVHTILPHELTHIFQGFIQEARDIPGWFIEGHATYFEPRQDYDYEGRVRAVAGHPNFPTLQADISLEFPGPDGRNRWAYDVGYTFIKYWIETYGWESHRLFWQAQVEMSFHEALEYATGRSFETLENEWRAWIGAPGPAPTLVPTPTLPPFRSTPTFQPPG